MDAYSVLNEIKKAMEANTKYSCQSNHFDLILSIDNKLTKSPLTWSWRHMKGHKYEQVEPLDRWETLNVECEHIAKLEWKEDQLLRESGQLGINIQD